VKLAIQTSRLPGDSLVDRFRNAARFGFDAVEVTIGPDFDLAEHLDEVQDAASVSGLPVSGICTHSIHDPLMPDAGERAQRFAGLASLLQQADQLGADGVISVPVRRSVVFPGVEDVERELADLAVAEFGRWVGSLPEGRAAVFLEPLNRYEAHSFAGSSRRRRSPHESDRPGFGHWRTSST
jgi:sugar phosphate isomerase/epimerase